MLSMDAFLLRTNAGHSANSPASWAGDQRGRNGQDFLVYVVLKSMTPPSLCLTAGMCQPTTQATTRRACGLGLFRLALNLQLLTRLRMFAGMTADAIAACHTGTDMFCQLRRRGSSRVRSDQRGRFHARAATVLATAA